MTVLPAVRLAGVGIGINDRNLAGTKPVCRLAVPPATQVPPATVERDAGVAEEYYKLPEGNWPALLVAFPYVKPFLARQEFFCYRDWALDSGAFTAYTSGKPIDHERYMELCLRLLATDPTLTEVFSLDVIDNPTATLRNARTEWQRGIPSIPTFHSGMPWRYLDELAAEFPKISLGGAVGLTKHKKMRWVAECFRRVWPKRIHGLGMASRDILMSFPFHSVDAASWAVSPLCFGQWKSLGDVRGRGSTQNLRAEIEYYLKLEREVQSRWKREMEMLEALPE